MGIIKINMIPNKQITSKIPCLLSSLKWTISTYLYPRNVSVGMACATQMTVWKWNTCCCIFHIKLSRPFGVEWSAVIPVPAHNSRCSLLRISIACNSLFSHLPLLKPGTAIDTKSGIRGYILHTRRQTRKTIGIIRVYINIAHLYEWVENLHNYDLCKDRTLNVSAIPPNTASILSYGGEIIYIQISSLPRLSID